jgi:hypothetical protein
MSEAPTSPFITKRKAVIMAEIEKTLSANDIQTTTENQYYMLLGIQEAWKEDADNGSIDPLYMLALTLLILDHQVKLLTQEDPYED